MNYALSHMNTCLLSPPLQVSTLIFSHQGTHILEVNK